MFINRAALKPKMVRIGIYTLIVFGMFYFSEGKPCPEKTRPHKTRCDAFYKCTELPSKTHVWVPEKCEQGLVYEQNLKLCVLPGDDWECTLGDIQTEKEYNKRFETVATRKDNISLDKIKDTDIYIVSNMDKDNVKADNGQMELILDKSISSEEEETDSDDDPYESSGNGGELVELDGFLQAENKETEDHMPENLVEHKETVSLQTASNIDPKLTAHLQRLSQLIDGLKQTYQHKEQEQTELRPDQLNAFLAHFNIKNKFDTLNPSAEQDLKQSTLPMSTETPTSPSTFDNLQTPSLNKTLLQEHLSTKLNPETKVVLTSALPGRYGNSGYSNSQIVVNRPEGSVLFSLPPYGNEPHFAEHVSEYSHNSPKISEDTLKTVLELSKQMIATQNMPKVVPNPAYYPQPILQPLFLPASAFSGNGQMDGSPFSSYYNNNNNNNNHNNAGNDYDNDNDDYNKPHQGHNHGGYKKPQRPDSNNSGGYNKPGTTIIHNNVIPVHLTSTNSGEKEIVDSYGQSLGLYPPLNAEENGNGNGYQTAQTVNRHQQNRYQDKNYLNSVTTIRPIVVSTTPANHYVGQYPSPYPSEISVTTARPFQYQPTASTIAEYYTPSPHLNENNVNSLFQTPERYPAIQYSNNIPRPMDLNRPNNVYQQMERPNQQISAPASSYYQQNNGNSLFPTQIIANKIQIRPNGQKIESMEVETDENGGGYDNPQQQQQQQQPQILTYNSYNNDKPDVSNQLTHSSYVDQQVSSNEHKHPPYMPRPQATSSATTSSSSYGGSTSALSSNKPKYPAFGSQLQTSYPDGTQLVNVGGNFISYEVFQNTILPFLGQSQSLNDLNSNVEVITCAAGVRQPNNTDCTRYYVCSKKDGKVLSYSCPPYTAFNAQTRICDARTYSQCNPDAIVSSYTVSENKRIQMEAIKALQDAKRRREQAQKAQHIANMLQNYGGQLQAAGAGSDSSETDMLNAYVQQAASMTSSSSSSSASGGGGNATPTLTRPVKKRKYYCKEGDKIPDQTSIYSYFVCYKNAQGSMKGHKMTCSKGLLFCPNSTMCTLPSKCRG